MTISPLVLVALVAVGWVLTSGTLAAATALPLARAIAVQEGYGTPGAVPTVQHNPGDLVDATGAIATYPTAAAGWAALNAQLLLILNGQSQHYRSTDSLASMGLTWANGDTGWAVGVVNALTGFGYTVTLDTTIGEAASL